MKNNKIIIIFLIILSFILISCNNNQETDNGANEEEVEHVHTFSDELSYDSSYHFNKATCGHDLRINEEYHSFGDNDYCLVCGCPHIKIDCLPQIMVGDKVVIYYYQSLLGYTSEGFINEIKAQLVYDNASPDIVSVSDAGIITALAPGKATIYVYYDYNRLKTLEVEVIEEPRIEYNCTDELMEEIDDLMNAFVIGNKITIGIRTFNNNRVLTGELVTKMHLDSFYYEEIESNPGASTKHSFELLEDGKVYRYIFGNNNVLTRKYLGTLEQYFDDYGDSQYSYDLIDEIKDIDYSKVQIDVLDNNKYQITMKLADFMDLYESLLGEDVTKILEYLDKSIFIITYEFGDNMFTMGVESRVHYNDGKTIKDETSYMEIYYDFSDFEDINLKDYVLATPTKPEEVYGYSDPNDITIYRGTIDNYFLFSLEEGYYYLEGTHLDGTYKASYLSVDVYDDEYNIILVRDHLSHSLLDNFIKIPKSGDYYFKIVARVGGQDYEKIRFIKISEPKKIQLKSLQTYSGTITNREYIELSYTSTNDKQHIKIKNNGKSELLIIFFNGNNYYSGNELIRIKAKEEILIDPNDGVNYLYLVKELKDGSEVNIEEKYNFTVTIVIK